MANNWIGRSRKYVIDEIGIVTPSGNWLFIKHVIFFPSDVNQMFIIQHAAGEEAIKLRSGASDNSPIHIWFDFAGFKIDGLKISQIDGGNADIYLKG